MFKKLKESINRIIDEKKELKTIEQAAYKEEKIKCDQERLKQRKEDARTKGIAKAHKKIDTKGIFKKLDQAADRMSEYNEKQKKNPVELVKFGSSSDEDKLTIKKV